MFEWLLILAGLAFGLALGYAVTGRYAKRKGQAEPKATVETHTAEPGDPLPAPIPNGVHTDVPLKMVGLVGPSFGGKSLITKQLVPMASAHHEWDDDNVAVSWSEVGATRPIESLYRVKMSTKGEDGKQRRLYQIHEILVELFGGSPAYGAPPYPEMVDLVHWVESLPVDEGGLGYARFAHSLGDALRDVDQHVFVKHLRAKAIREQSNMLAEAKAQDESGLNLPSAHVLVVPDLHTVSEVEWLVSHTYAFVFGVNIAEEPDELVKLAENSYDTNIGRKFWSNHPIEREALSIDPNMLTSNFSLRQGAEVKHTAEQIVDIVVGRKSHA